MSDQRTANILGAFAVALADRLHARSAVSAGHGAAAPAAIVGIGTTPGQSIDQLRSVLQLSHSGVVRLVDRLAAAGLVTRHPGADGRSVALYLTTQGEQAKQLLLEERERMIQQLLQDLPTNDLTILAGLLETLLARLITSPEQADHACRLCDEHACPALSCPIEQAITR